VDEFNEIGAEKAAVFLWGINEVIFKPVPWKCTIVC
jgi:hypothetical protein